MEAPPVPQGAASRADTAVSNAVTSVTVSQQESEGQASEPANGSTGEPPSPVSSYRSTTITTRFNDFVCCAAPIGNKLLRRITRLLTLSFCNYLCASNAQRAARSQVSTAVSFEGARAAGSAVQPERSVDEDSALSAAEPDGRCIGCTSFEIKLHDDAKEAARHRSFCNCNPLFDVSRACANH